MKLKSILIVVALLAALSAVVHVLQRPPAPAAVDPRLGHSLSQGAPLDQANQLRLSDQGKQVTLTRQTDGNWRVTSYYDFPADFKKLSAFVSSLNEATIQRLVTSNPERLARLEFKDTKIELLDNSSKGLWTITLGKNADLGGRYVRFGEEQKAYLAGFTAWIDADAKNWADSQILDVKADEVASVEVPFADSSSVKLSRIKKEDPWTSDKTPSGQRVNTAKISSLLNSTGTLRFVETTEPGDANAATAKAHERVFNLTMFSGKTYTVALGRKPEDKKLKPPSPAAATPTPSPDPNAAGAYAPKSDSPDHKSPAKAGATAAPEYETIPAGPVFAFVTSSDANESINAMMQKRAFQIADYAFTNLPQKPEELFEPIPPPAPASAPTVTTPTFPAPNAPQEPVKKDIPEGKKP